jgi:hypothetical protein
MAQQSPGLAPFADVPQAHLRLKVGDSQTPVRAERQGFQSNREKLLVQLLACLQIPLAQREIPTR